VTAGWDRLAGLIDRGRLEANLRELVDIPSVNPFGGHPGREEGEQEVAECLATRLHELGCEPTTQSIGPRRCNVVAALGGADGPSLMLAGHMDTVRGEVRIPKRVPPGVVFGRGACDMKAALACYLEVLHALTEGDVRLRGRLQIAAVADEEFNQQGAKHLARAGEPADGVVIGEPTSLTVCPATMGLLNLRVTTSGRSTHGGVADQGANAIYRIAPILSTLQQHAGRLAASGSAHPLLGAPRLNVGTIKGGTQPNTVPDQCQIEVSRRLLPAERSATVRAELERLLQRSVPNRDVCVSAPTWEVDAYELSPRHPLVKSIRLAVRAATGAEADIRGFPASSDAPYFGTPAVLCGPGHLPQAHAADEHIEIEQLVLATRAYLHLVLGQCDPA
jgi:succinyl-diaminopimelate desuccinylase